MTASRRFAFLLLLIGIQLATLFVALRRLPEINHDVALCIHGGQLVLAGKQLYLDFFDTQPPLIFYVSAALAFLSRLLPWPIPVALQLVVWVLSALSTVATWRLLTADPDDRAPLGAGVALSMALFFLWVAGVGQWGQREHLFLMAFGPFVAARFSRWEGRPVSRAATLAGLAAAAASWVKPGFVAILLTPDVFWFAAHRRLRPLIGAETVAFAAASAAYFAHFFFLPDQVRANMDRWVAMMAMGYGVFETPLWTVVRDRVVWLGPVLTAATFLIRPKSGGPALRLGRALALSSMAGALVFVAQKKGWTYQNLPQFGGAALLGGVALAAAWARLREWRPALFVPAARTAFIAAALGASLWLAADCLVLIDQHGRESAIRGELMAESAVARAVVRWSKPGDPVLVLATELRGYPLLLQLGRWPGSRFLWTYPIAMAYRGVAADARGRFPYRRWSTNATNEEREFLDALCTDIERNQPPLILTNNSRLSLGCPKGFNLMDYLWASEFADRCLSEYRLVSYATDEEIAAYRRSTTGVRRRPLRPEDLKGPGRQ